MAALVLFAGPTGTGLIATDLRHRPHIGRLHVIVIVIATWSVHVGFVSMIVIVIVTVVAFGVLIRHAPTLAPDRSDV